MVKVFCSERPAAQTDRATLVGHWSSHHWTGPIINKEQLWSLLAYISKYPPCMHASARFCFLLVSYRPLGLLRVVVGELREVA